MFSTFSRDSLYFYSEMSGIFVILTKRKRKTTHNVLREKMKRLELVWKHVKNVFDNFKTQEEEKKD